jgi:hypothetical protein
MCTVGANTLMTQSQSHYMDQKGNLFDLLDYVMSVLSNIHFTMHTKTNGHLPFSRIDIFRKLGGAFV